MQTNGNHVPRDAATSPVPVNGERHVDLFVGAGGLALGLQRAGFLPALTVDWDERSIATLEANSQRYTRDWSAVRADVRDLDYSAIALSPVSLVSAGAPCQPFSIGGQLRGEDDERNMFPEVVRAVRELRPRAFVFENVRGLLFPRARRYFDYILAQLRVPSRTRRSDEGWLTHKSALERIPRNRHEYYVDWQVLNAADFGLPQNRPRLVVVGIDARENITFPWPETTHCQDALVNALLGNEYWELHDVPTKVRDSAREGLTQRTSSEKPRWTTIRDLTMRLGPPTVGDTSKEDASHSFVPGARLYAKHRGSRLDWPAKTVKAGVHGCPGGEHIVILDDGSHRYLTVRECAALQGFPDDYILPELRSVAMRQLGNAVPPALAEAVGMRLVEALHG